MAEQRLVQIDSLRGLAAVSVMLFHLTTRFGELFGSGQPASVAFPAGYYGVNLFFIISGFVIFMTLERVARPMDFVVSRFSRLFPAYWLSILLTFTITHALGLPDKLVGFDAAIVNTTMLQGFFFTPNVDAVYWTLEVELMFYFGMGLLFRFGQLRNIHHWLLALLGMRLAYLVMHQAFGVELSWTLSRLLVLDYISWFALGISIYQLARRKSDADVRHAVLVAACALFTVLATDSARVAGLALALAALVYAASTARLRFLGWRPLVWLGAISYPLYLLHEYIGWSLQLRLLGLGLTADAALLATILLTLALASAVSYGWERPAMTAIRALYKRRSAVAA